MTDTREMGVPECFSDEYAFHERNGTLPPYSGPVYPDYGSDAAYLYDNYDEPTEPPGWGEEPPAPCQGPPPVFTFLGMPPSYRPHMSGCWDLHAPDDDGCPPPF